jgi:hypothetical protein
LAGTLILHMSAENSFWMLVVLLSRSGPYRLQSMFLPGQPQVIVSLYCLDRLIEMFMPVLFSRFKEIKVTPILFAHAWFTTLFSYTFPVVFTRQIWTIFFVTGPSNKDDKNQSENSNKVCHPNVTPLDSLLKNKTSLLVFY